MANMNLFSLTILAAAVVVLGVTLQTSNVVAQCGKHYKGEHEQEEFIKKALKTCEHVLDKGKDCEKEAECCYALGTLQCVDDQCICDAIYKYHCDLNEYTKIFESCSGKKRHLKCYH